MDRQIPKPGEFYSHFKQKLYQIIGVATDSENEDQVVVYQALYGSYGLFVRTLDSFMSEVDHRKYPNSTQLYRFEKVIPESMITGKKVQTMASEDFQTPADAYQAGSDAGFGRDEIIDEDADMKIADVKSRTIPYIPKKNVQNGTIPIYRGKDPWEDDAGLQEDINDSAIQGSYTDNTYRDRLQSDNRTNNSKSKEDGVSEVLNDFLEAKTPLERRDIILHYKNKITGKDLDSIYISLGITGFGGNEIQQVEGLVKYLNVCDHYDGQHLR